jgi:predicted ATP-dependent serine protease
MYWKPGLIDAVNFTDEWLASFGRPELRGSWLVYGGSGSGKTTFMLRLGKYLTNFCTVAYNSLEQGLSLSMQRAWERVDMAEAGSGIILLEKEPLGELRARLKKRRSPDAVIIDSMHYWLGFSMSDYMSLLDEFKSKLFVFCAHEQKGFIFMEKIFKLFR